MRISTRLIVEDGEDQVLVGETLGCIDVVHHVGKLPSVRLQFSDAIAPFGRYVPMDGKPDYIELSRMGPHKRLSLAHEIGHLLDHALEDYRGYASQKQNSPLAEVIRATEASRAIQMLRTAFTQNQESGFGLQRRQINYWLEPVERWARAYAQYIAVRSGSQAMQDEIRIARSLQPFAFYQYVQWDANDFEPIAQAIDTAFRKLGWRA